ncbi:SDR family NAD(P)-dependent oxidoreductase [Pseudalkalibacillus decolorationis]|uniref:SDR family NAD(P)-dependent oxidoreductase n=1 Tax=Pseudalkalibacillus decolorationis TaxID=163879 RepID=UPI002149429C|nr:SDR family NAD(P)-dependent oxidoreductase [Pseudalkalibacillus decolorationis]
MKSKQETILITGASGFTGKHACNYFVQEGMRVVGLSRTAEQPDTPYEYRQHDLSDYEGLEYIVQKINPTYILHLAGMNSVSTSWEDPIQCMNTNLISTLNVLEAVRKKAPGCQVLVVGSLLQFNPLNETHAPHPYSLSKSFQTIAAQNWSHFFNQKIMIAKPSNLIGPGHSSGVCSIFAQKMISIENGETENQFSINPNVVRDFVDVRDAVRAYHTLLKHGENGQIYEIGSGKGKSLREIVDELQKLTTTQLNVTETSENEVDVYVAENVRPITRLNWKPIISFSHSISDIVMYFRT